MSTGTAFLHVLTREQGSTHCLLQFLHTSVYLYTVNTTTLTAVRQHCLRETDPQQKQS